MNNHQPVVVGMSGGVDSSVAALILKEQGYDVTGVMLNLWTAEGCEDSNRCCAPEAQEIARKVSYDLGIPFYVLDTKDEFYKRVVNSFLQGICNGYTPNPCWQCNAQLRWEVLLGFARKVNAKMIATGHYARIIEDKGIYHLFCGIDKAKDQSYVLSGLRQTQLQNTLFPLGEFTKEQVRTKAKQFGLINWEEPDSQDLCFIGDLKLVDFLKYYAAEALNPGEIIDIDGNILGRHDGLARYTIGQRKGIRIAGKEPYFVVSKNTEKNQLVIGRKMNSMHKTFVLKSMNWIIKKPKAKQFNANVMVRYHSKKYESTVRNLGNDIWLITGNTAIEHITPGQVGVLYDSDEVIGGGVIDSIGDMKVQ